jgi:hypothetical protein
MGMAQKPPRISTSSGPRKIDRCAEPRYKGKKGGGRSVGVEKRDRGLIELCSYRPAGYLRQGGDCTLKHRAVRGNSRERIDDSERLLARIGCNVKLRRRNGYWIRLPKRLINSARRGESCRGVSGSVDKDLNGAGEKLNGAPCLSAQIRTTSNDKAMSAGHNVSRKHFPSRDITINEAMFGEDSGAVLKKVANNPPPLTLRLGDGSETC